MHFSADVYIPGFVVLGGLAALIPVGILIALQLLMAAFMTSAISLGGPVHFEPKIWVGVALYVVVTFTIGASISAYYGNWWSGGLAGIIFAACLLIIARLMDRRRHRM